MRCEQTQGLRLSDEQPAVRHGERRRGARGKERAAQKKSDAVEGLEKEASLGSWSDRAMDRFGVDGG